MDKFSESLEKIIGLAEQVAQPLGLTVVEGKFGQAGKQRTLELTIHRKGSSVSLDDCEQVSRGLDLRLEEGAASGDPLLQGAYLLEVQSPGIDRHLKSDRELRAFIGEKVLIQSKQRLTDLGLGANFVGTLSGVAEGQLILDNPKPYVEPSSAGKHKAKAKAKDKTSAKKDLMVEPASTGDTQVTLDISGLTQIRLHREWLDKLIDKQADAQIEPEAHI